MQTLKKLEKVIEHNAPIPTDRGFCPDDPIWYLTKLIFEFDKEKYSFEFIELIYVTLSAWNKNNGEAELNDFNSFNESIIENKEIMEQLSNKKIIDIREKIVKNTLEELFYKLKLVNNHRNSIVIFSKVMHFYFPELIVPIDRNNIFNYFYSHTKIPSKGKSQIIIFFEIENEFSDFSISLEPVIGNSSECNVLYITEIMSTMVISYLIPLEYITEKINKGDFIGIEDRYILRRLCSYGLFE